MRGRGYGLRLWQHAISRVRAANIGLDGVLGQVPNYEKSGFAIAHRNTRFAGIAGEATPPPSRVVALGAVPFEQLLAYDAGLFPARRPEFLRAWCALPESIGFAVMRDGELGGYGIIRRSHSGYRIGPLFADDEAAAEALYAALTGSVEAGAAVSMDVPEPNRAALRLAERLSLTPSFETARMYTNGAPPIDLGRVFGVTTLELG